MEERNVPMMNPHDSTADLFTDSSSAANCSHRPFDGISKVHGGCQITNNEEDESLNKKAACDIFSDDDEDDSNYKTELHCHQDQRRMSLTSIVAVDNTVPYNPPVRRTIDLGHGSDLIYIQRFLPFQQSWTFFDYLDKHIPWTRPTIRVFGRSCLQPRDTCYVASSGLTSLVYSGYRPHAYSWDDFPPLKEILDAIYKALPGSRFNSLLLNRYKGANDYVGWHADDEKLYGPTPEIASVSFGCERDFVLKKKKLEESSHEKTGDGGPASKRLKKSSKENQQTFTLKHGSLLVMRGYTQRDWIHSVPKRAKAEGTRINLTFRLVL
ncbi:DNA oxidative demethylase ALKBH2 [Eutrema salsugineum]|uniref:DNA oxidative demethylase ALKBH2 n=1 Tax=Eutrema salsugineum TaxID=72664 RepID=UPI000CECEC33|nr:DNA oxidative demethylase ALKBH2 [Eutrema salsugineum]XP_024014193.1 DNA oxidative demethylase ALKBH2 [Eutrema salsugineum]XP_024014195.1 DNA oxidative demethylase ALKBH2 [Eutrema salsugineum]